MGIWIGENESTEFWLGILNGLKNREVENSLIACYVSYKDLKPLMAGLKKVYAAVDRPISSILRKFAHCSI